jgi:peptidyl-prolyl cis-trans isomerase B (cyclophilin B)
VNWRPVLAAFLVSVGALVGATAQQPGSADPPKANSRPSSAPTPRRAKPEPFDGATVERMNAQCVTLQTALGNIELEMYADAAPETVRNFLNLTAIGAFDTTVFNRVVKDFVVQGGRISAHEHLTDALVERAQRTIPDEPNYVKHERGVLSMARPDTPNGATTNFFILIKDSFHLDGKFAAFGRVRQGLDVADKINQGELNGDKPVNPVRINRAVIAACSPASSTPKVP